MKLIIAGCREGFVYSSVEDAFLKATERIGVKAITEIVSGTARGVDTHGEAIAKKYGIRVAKFPADWDRFGKRAGYLRNEKMAEYADALLACWDGKSRGTKHMIDLAREHGLKVFVYKQDDIDRRKWQIYIDHLRTQNGHGMESSGGV